MATVIVNRSGEEGELITAKFIGQIVDETDSYMKIKLDESPTPSIGKNEWKKGEIISIGKERIIEAWN